MSNLINRVVTALASHEGTEWARSYLSGWTSDSMKPHFMRSEYQLWKMCEQLEQDEIKLATTYLEHYFDVERRQTAITGCLKYDSKTLRDLMVRDELTIAAVEEVLFL